MWPLRLGGRCSEYFTSRVVHLEGKGFTRHTGFIQAHHYTVFPESKGVKEEGLEKVVGVDAKGSAEAYRQ